MFYAICDGVPGSSGPPFLFYKAETLGDLHSCPYINETSLIFDGNESHIGKLIKVNIEKSNQNSLFGKVTDKMKAA